jgi:hypothetical protein|tara:strand:- start:127 stop:285 length:159 start_codon:yes stop_codon:yes gene_type:complete
MEIAEEIFADIDKAIEETISKTPVPLENSEFLKRLKQIKKKYCNGKKEETQS